MGKYKSQALTLNLAALQEAGNASEGDFNLGAPLPADCLVVGLEVVVTEEFQGPGLVSAKATVGLAPDSPRTGQLAADLMTVGSYDDGGQHYLVSVAFQGCTLDALTSGLLTATVYYDQFKL